MVREVFEGGFVGGDRADDEAEFDFMVEVYAFGSEDGAGFGEEDGRWGFEEEEGLSGARGGELRYVVSVEGLVWESWRKGRMGGEVSTNA